MSGYILCQVKKAQKPYSIENISTNIYSIEELCFYLCHNLYLVDESIRNEELLRWLEEELGLGKLAVKLQSHLRRNEALEEFLYPILKEINYLSYEEMRSLNGQLDKMEEEPLVIHRKKRGDCLVENGMYVNAIQTYREALKAEEPRPGFYAGIYHNLGCAYSYLFQKEEALECFEKAYGISHTLSALRTFLIAFYHCKGKEAYESKLKELEVDITTRQKIQEEIDRIKEQSAKIEVEEKEIDSVLERLTVEYHRSTSA